MRAAIFVPLLLLIGSALGQDAVATSDNVTEAATTIQPEGQDLNSTWLPEAETTTVIEVETTTELLTTTTIPTTETPIIPASSVITGWSHLDRMFNPWTPPGGRYLHTSVPGMYRLTLDKVVEENVTVSAITISLDYYTVYNGLDQDGYPPIAIAIQACWHLSAIKAVKPANFTNGGDWQTLEYVAEVGQDFDPSLQRCQDEIHVLVKVDNFTESFVAIRNVVIHYDVTYDQQLTGWALRSCNSPSNCDFKWSCGSNMMSWSRQGQPTGSSYLRPTKDGDVLNVTFSNLNETSDAILNVTYLATKMSSLRILAEGSSSGILLTPTDIGDGQDWLTFTLRITDLIPDLTGKDTAVIQIEGSFDNYESLNAAIAVNISVEIIQRDSTVSDGSANYFVSWSENSPQEKWHIVPEGPLVPGQSEITLNPLPVEGVAYIFSDWFKLNTTFDEVELKFKTISGPHAHNISLTVFLLDHYWNITERTQYGVSANETQSYVINYPVNHDGTLRRVVFKFDYSGQSQGWVSLASVSLGDGCDPSPCVFGQCIRLAPNTSKCICPKEKRGRHCELEDYCGQVAINSTDGQEKLGDDLCLDGGAYDCYSHDMLDSVTPFDCACPEQSYWNPFIHKCEKMANCAVVTRCPLDLTMCSEVGELNETDLCPECLPGYSMQDGLCGPAQTCDGLGSASCLVLEASRGRAPGVVSFCPNGFQLTTDGLNNCMAKTSCPEVVRVSHGCDQGCQWAVQDGVLNVTCTCLEGWSRNGSMCVPVDPMLNTTCTEDTLPIISLGRVDCSCKPGHLLDGATGDCVRYCKAAEYSTSLQNQLESVCGQGIRSCVDKDGATNQSVPIHCTCPGGYATNMTTGLCEFVDPCQDGGKGAEDCQNRNMVCMRKVVVTSSNLIVPAYECACAPGQAKDPQTGSCAHQCAIVQNKINCRLENKECQVNYAADTPDCVCQPGFIPRAVENTTKTECILSTYAYESPLLTIRLPSNSLLKVSKSIQKRSLEDNAQACLSSPDPEDCIKFVKHPQETSGDIVGQEEKNLVLSELKYSIDLIFLGYQGYEPEGLVPISYDRIGDNLYQVKMAVSFGHEVNSTVWTKRMADECLRFNGSGADSCILPGGVSLLKSSIIAGANETVPGPAINPCVEYNSGRINYCPESSQCSLVNSGTDMFAFSCTCAKTGFTVEDVVQLDKNDPTIRKEICVDIDECKLDPKACPSGSTCLNTIGSWECNCDDGLKKQDGLCIDSCSGIMCENGGHCAKLPGSLAQCSCPDGWRGEKCEVEDAKASAFKAGLTWSSIILIAALIIVIGYSFWKIKSLKKQGPMNGKSGSYNVSKNDKRPENHYEEGTF
ncbi:hypothetical protein HDE_09136 [Halotydeus destructor]|nr:hypothetical protein HDE_09136 [Halotydeus destructor]